VQHRVLDATRLHPFSSAPFSRPLVTVACHASLAVLTPLIYRSLDPLGPLVIWSSGLWIARPPGLDMSKIKSRSSRRAPALKESDYDHEIRLFDSAADDTEANAVEGGDGTVPEVDLERPPSPSPEPSARNTTIDAAIDMGDGAGDGTTSRRPSGMALTPNSGGALSPVVTATSATPLLNTLSTLPTAVDGGTSSASRKPSRGRNSTRYGSISKIVAEPQVGAPSVQVEGECDPGCLT
jgi:hypothetical protein